ncbi:MAG: nucleotidyltransferase domain-containing protein [Saprospiraceae bacterium]|nr:MAG: nucleotidyltransferase domain-containing protein [Saprospiraceae bacterium]
MDVHPGPRCVLCGHSAGCGRYDAAFWKKRDKILQAAKQRLTERFGDKIKDVILFGSRAWGKPHRWPDWDFVVVVRGEYDWRFEHTVWEIMADIDLDYEVITQTLIISEQELNHSLRGHEPVFTDALQNGIYA